VRRHLRLAVLVVAALAAASNAMAARAAPAGSWRTHRARLVRELRSRDLARLEISTQGLAEFDGREAAEVALELLRHSNARVAGAAQEALSAMRSEAAAGAMVAGFSAPRGSRVRIRLLRALRGNRDKRIATLLVRCLDVFKDDPHLVATLEAVEANAVVAAAPKVVGFLRRRRSFGVRLSAVRALGRTAGRDEIAALIKCLDPAEGRIRHEAAAGLRSRTGRNLGEDKAAWGRWWSGSGRERDLPGVPARGARGGVLSSPGPAKGDSTYHGIVIHAKRVIFVLDKSESMKRGRPQSRMTAAKEELCRVIESLGDDVRFNVIIFSSRVIQWRPGKLVLADRMTRQSACIFIRSANAYGETDTLGAMELALAIAKMHDAETICLLTDGGPCVGGKFQNMDAVRSKITRANEFLKVRINAIGVFQGAAGESARKAKEPTRDALRGFLKALASENDGRFVER